jgi:hypothetical protein
MEVIYMDDNKKYSTTYPLIGLAILVVGLLIGVVTGYIGRGDLDGSYNQPASSSQPVHGEMIRTNLN